MYDYELVNGGIEGGFTGSVYNIQIQFTLDG